MDSVLHQLFSGYFQPQDWGAHRKETISRRMAAYQTRFSSLLQRTADDRGFHIRLASFRFPGIGRTPTV